MTPGIRAALIVSAGGFAGTLARYLVSGLVHRYFPPAAFPFGTLAVNLTGCLLVGTVAGITDARWPFSPELRALVLVGLLGGFTTFSAFGFETFALLKAGLTTRAVANVALQVLGGLLLVWLGYLLGSGGVGST